MPQTLHINDFSAGWSPSEDPTGGRRNALLKMDALNLDKNGALVLNGGTYNQGANEYSDIAHTIYVKSINGSSIKYATLVDGAVFRDATVLSAAGGSITRAAFGAAYNYAFICSGAYRVKDNGTTASNLGIANIAAAPTAVSAGAGVITGDIEYAQVAVANFNGAYLAKSGFSAISTVLTLTDESVTVTGADPVAADAQANELWIYRRGGLLERWYRIKRLTSSYTTPFVDNMSDLDALELDEVGNSNLLPVNSTNITDDILGIAGLVNARMVYFTATSIIIAERYSPDSYDPRRVRYYSGSSSTGAEIFLWCLKIGENAILVGTSIDIYVLTGSFANLTNGDIDVELRALGVSQPPISTSVAIYKTNAVYMAADGWRLLDTNGNTESLSSPHLQGIYTGETIGFNEGVPILPYPTLNYPCAVAREKLYTVVPTITLNDPDIPFGTRMDIYDFQRKYWRSCLLPPILLATSDDDTLIGFYTDDPDYNLRIVESVFNKALIDINQPVWFLTIFQDNGDPRNRKDALTLKLRCYTGGSNATLNIYKDGVFTTPIEITTTLNASVFTEVFYDISTLVGTFKSLAIEITGELADFLLTDISVDYEPHPLAITKYTHLRQSFGELDAHKKKVSTWPIIIDTLGESITMTPYIDGVAVTTSSISTNGKKIHIHKFAVDTFGLDFSYTLQAPSANKLFELWESGQPEIVQTLPLGKYFDNVGPLEFFKYGRIKKIRFRIFSFSSGNIAYSLFINENSPTSGNIAVTANLEQIYEIDFPKTTGGDIMRLTLLASFEFHRYYVMIQVDKKGNSDEAIWVPFTQNDQK